MNDAQRLDIVQDALRMIIGQTLMINGAGNPNTSRDLMAIIGAMIFAIMSLNETENGISRRINVEWIELIINNTYENLGKPK
jgi:hypothetical protein